MIVNKFQIIFILKHTHTFLDPKVHSKFTTMPKQKVKITFQIYKQLMIKHIQDLRKNVKKLKKSENLKENNLIGKRRNKT